MINLSGKTFSFFDFKLLNKNLNFVPHPGNYNKNKFDKEVDHFLRNIILKSHFGKISYNHTEKSGLTFKTNKNWIPNKIHHTVGTFMEAFRNDLNTNNKSTNKQLDNLTKEERNSLNTFINRDDIIILKADKGGAVGIMNTKDYIEEANRQLNNTDFYTSVDMDPTQAHAELINTSIRNFVKEKLITEKSGKALSVENPKTPRFYMLPKYTQAK